VRLTTILAALRGFTAHRPEYAEKS
jgi:hypothetical protein